MEISSGVAGLLGAFIGAGASIWMSYINNNKSYKLQIDLENLKRQNKSKDYQIDTLIKLQKDILTLKKLTYELLDLKIVRYINFKMWTNIYSGDDKELYNEEEDEQIKSNWFDLKSEIFINNHKLTNLELQEGITLAMKELSSVLTAKTKDDAKKINENFRKKTYNKIMREISIELRKTY